MDTPLSRKVLERGMDDDDDDDDDDLDTTLCRPIRWLNCLCYPCSTRAQRVSLTCDMIPHPHPHPWTSFSSLLVGTKVACDVYYIADLFLLLVGFSAGCVTLLYFFLVCFSSLSYIWILWLLFFIFVCVVSKLRRDGQRERRGEERRGEERRGEERRGEVGVEFESELDLRKGVE